MFVQFRTTACGPGVYFELGKTYNLPLAEAKPYLDGGYAHEVQSIGDGKWQRVETLPAPKAPAAPPTGAGEFKPPETPKPVTAPKGGKGAGGKGADANPPTGDSE